MVKNISDSGMAFQSTDFEAIAKDWDFEVKVTRLEHHH